MGMIDDKIKAFEKKWQVQIDFTLNKDMPGWGYDTLSVYTEFEEDIIVCEFQDGEMRIFNDELYYKDEFVEEFRHLAESHKKELIEGDQKK